MEDPAVVAFILVGVVGSIAVVMSVSAGWELSHDLARATDGWTAPLLIRRYEAGDAGRRKGVHEAEILERHGYRRSGPSPAAGDQAGSVTYVLVDSR